MVRVLAVADEIEESLFGRRLLSVHPELVLAAGDLPWDYLEHIASTVDAPVVFVPGNHDPALPAGRRTRGGLHLLAGMPVADPRPLGARNADLDVVDAAGLRIAGLGGCVRYRDGPNMYTQQEYSRRARTLLRRVRRHGRRFPGPVDVLLTHAPPRGLGDGPDRAHEGIEALHGVLTVLRPRWHLHGHVHPYGQPRPDRRVGGTTVRNVIPSRVIDVPTREEVLHARR